MFALAEQLLVVVVGTLILLAPGAAVITWAGVPRLIPGYLVPAAAFTATTVLVTGTTVVTLAAGAPITWNALALAAITLFAMWGAAPELRASRRRSESHRDLLLEPAVKAWHRRIHPGAAGLALATAFLGMLIGGALNGGDSLFHTAFAVKLLELDHPTFQNTRLFFDGGPHPGYIVPVAQQLMALIALVSGTDVATVVWMMAAVTTPLATLAYGGLGYVLFRSHTGAVAAMGAFVLIQMLTRSPFFGPVAGSMLPGTLTVHVVIPTAIAAWLLTMWPSDTFAQRRTAGLLLGAVAAIVVLHVSYVMFLGVALAGYLLVWSMQSPWARQIVRCHATTSAAALLATALLVAAYAPALSRLNGIGEPAGSGRAPWFKSLFIGDPDSFHLRADYLVALGGPAVLGLAGVLLAVAFRRDPAAWYLIGATAVTLTVALTGFLFPVLVALASPAQAARLAIALPTVFGFALAMLCLGWLCGRLWQRGLRYRVFALGIAATSAAGLSGVTSAWPALENRDAVPVVPAWIVNVVWAGVLLIMIAMLVGSLRRWRSWRRAQRASQRGLVPPRRKLQRTGPPLSRALVDVPLPGVAIAVLVAVVGSFPAWSTLPRVLRHEVSTRPASALQVDALDAIDPQVQRALRDLPERSVVMAPHTRSLELLAVAPLYAVAVTKAQTARTAANLVRDRREVTRDFYASSTTDSVRERILRTERVDAVLTTPNSSVARYMERAGDRFRLVARGARQDLYTVRHAGDRGTDD